MSYFTQKTGQHSFDNETVPLFDTQQNPSYHRYPACKNQIKTLEGLTQQAHTVDDFQDQAQNFSTNESSHGDFYNPFLSDYTTQSTEQIGEETHCLNPPANTIIFPRRPYGLVPAQSEIYNDKLNLELDTVEVDYLEAREYDNSSAFRTSQAGGYTLTQADDEQTAFRSSCVVTSKLGVPFPSYVPSFPNGPQIDSRSLTMILEEEMYKNNVQQDCQNIEYSFQSDHTAFSPWQLWNDSELLSLVPNKQTHIDWTDLTIDPTVLALPTPYDEYLEESAEPAGAQPVQRRKAKFIPPRKWSASRLRQLACRDRPRNLPGSIDWDMKANSTNVQDIPINQLQDEATVASGSYTVAHGGDDGIDGNIQLHTAHVSIGSKEAIDEGGEVVPFRATVVAELGNIVCDVSWIWDGQMCTLVRPAHVRESTSQQLSGAYSEGAHCDETGQAHMFEFDQA